MADPINLRQARKAKARQEGQEAAAQARARFGASKAEKARRKAEADQSRAHLDAHKREPNP